MEELVDGKSCLAAHPERRIEGVCARAQMGHGTQIVHAHLFLLQRILRPAGAQHRDGVGVDFKRLLGVGGQHQGAGDLKTGVQAALGNFCVIGQFISLKNDLYGLIAAAVRQRDKADIFRIAYCFCPAADSDFGAVCGGGRVQRYEFGSLHGWSTPLTKNNDCSYYSGFGPNCTVLFYKGEALSPGGRLTVRPGLRPHTDRHVSLQ